MGNDIELEAKAFEKNYPKWSDIDPRPVLKRHPDWDAYDVSVYLDSVTDR